MECVPLSTDPWPVEPASMESVSEAEDWATSILSSVELLPAATAAGFRVPCLPHTASFVALWATLRFSLCEVGCVIDIESKDNSEVTRGQKHTCVTSLMVNLPGVFLIQGLTLRCFRRH